MIREARIDDLDKIVELAKQMHGESRYSVYDFNPDKLKHFAWTTIENEAGMLFVYEQDGEVIGGVMGWIDQMYFGSDTVLCDLALFVTPGKRGSLAGAKLIKRFVEFGKEKNVSQIVLSNSTGVDKDRVAALYEKLGLTHAGYVFSYNNKKGE